MALDCAALLAAAAAHAGASGWFDRVNQYEALNPPGKGLACSLWVQRMRPVANMSGLNSTAAQLILTVRIQSVATAAPQAGIDPAMLNAADALMRAYSGDYTLGDLIEYVDLLGRHGTALEGNAGWIQVDGGGAARIFDITLPLVVRGLWDQAE